MKLPLNNLRGRSSSIASRRLSSYSRSLPLEQLEERRLLAVAPLEFDDVQHAEAAPAAAANVIVVDDGDAGFDMTGGWIKLEPRPEAHLSDYLYNAAGTGADVATWTFSGLEPGGSYVVSATWVEGGNRATNAPFTIFDNTTPVGDAILVDQQADPVADHVEGNANFQIISDSVTISGSTLVVKLSDDADGFVIADAVRIELLTSAVVVDDGDAEFSTTGVWTKLEPRPEAHLSDYLYNGAGTGADVASWTFTDLVPGGRYEVSATWVSGGNRATNAPYTIFDNTTPVGDPILVDQQAGPAPNHIESGVNFQIISTVVINSGTLVVKLSDDANGFVIADAVRIDLLTSLLIADDGDSGYSTTGAWTSLLNRDAAYQSDYSYNGAGTGADVATWTFSGLEPGSEYEVSTTWVASSNRATNAPFTIFDDTTAFGGPIRVNQQVASVADHIEDGVKFQIISESVIITSDTLVVKLSDDANGFVIADAVRIELVVEDPNEGKIVVNGTFDAAGGGSNDLTGWRAPLDGVVWQQEGPGDGVARIISDTTIQGGAAGARFTQAVTVSPNTAYRFEFDFVSTDVGQGTSVWLRLIDGNGARPLQPNIDATDNGHLAFDLFTLNDPTLNIWFFSPTSPSLQARDFTIDNVTLREIIPKLVEVSGFEPGEDFSEGFLDGQAGWTSMVDPAEGPVSPLISNANPNGGSQHIRIEKNFALPAADSDDLGPFNGAISGQLPVVEGGVFATSLDVFISDRNGASYDVIGQSLSQGDVTWQVRFESNGTIRVADNIGNERQLVDANATWTPGEYKTLRVIVDTGRDRIAYEYGGVEIYAAAGGVFGADAIEEIIVKSNNAHIGDFADFDNLTVTDLTGGSEGESEQPDLVRAVPNGWDDSVVLSTEAGTHSDASIIEPGEDIFVDLAVSNIGLSDAGEFSAQLMLDGVPIDLDDPLVVDGPLSPLDSAMFVDVNIGSLAAGTYTISLEIDFVDGVPDGNVDESDETNNTYARVFTVGTTDETGPIVAAPFNRFGPFGGLIAVSNGTSGRLNTADDSDEVTFMGQAGETISFMVTPTNPLATLSLELNGSPVGDAAAAGAPVFVSPLVVATTEMHTLRIFGDAITDYEVKLVRNASIESGDSANGSELSLDAATVLGRTGVLAKTHSGADVDEFTIDLTGKAGRRVDVVLDGVTADFSGQTLELLGPDGSTVVATGTASPQGPNATNLDLAIHDFLVPSDGIFTVRVTSSLASGLYYTVVATDNLALESEPNDDAGGAAAGLRRLNNDNDSNISVGAGFLNAEASEVRRLFAVDSATDEIVELDPDSGAEINRFDLPTPGAAGAAGLAFDGSSLFYASGEAGQRTIYEINPDTEAVIDSDTFASIGLGDGIGSLAIVGGQLAVLDGLTDVVTLIDTASDTIAGTLDLLASGSSAASLFAFTGDGLTGADSRGSVFTWGLRLDSSLSVAIIEFDATTGELLGSFNAPSDNGVPGLAFIGDDLFALDSNSTVFKLDPDSGAVLDSYSLGTNAWITALGADGGTAALGGDTFTVFLEAGQVLNASTETPLNDPSVDPANTLNPRLVIFDPSGNEIGSDNDSGDGNNASLSVTAGAAGLYRIQVQAESGQGEYRLNASTGDPGPTITVNDVSVAEGGGLTFTVMLSDEVAGGFNVSVNLADLSATGGAAPLNSPEDYDNVVADLTFVGTTGETQQFTVATLDDAVLEGTETFTVSIDANNQLVNDADTAVGTITDNDSAAVTVEDISADEGGGLTFTVTLDNAVQGGFDVSVNLADLLATGGAAPLNSPEDFDNVVADLTFAGTAGETQQFTVATLDDADVEADETFTVNLNASNSLVIDTDTAIGTITDNDDAGLPEDLTGNGIVDFQDLTILLANWNQMVSAADGNLVSPDTSVVDFADLTSLLAAWSTPGAGAAAGANAVAADVAVTEMTASGEVTSSSSESETTRARPRRRAGQPAARRSLRATAVDLALGSDQDDAFASRIRRGHSAGRRADR